jgi:hypothetical protein
MASELRKFWTEKKDLAAKLYVASLEMKAREKADKQQKEWKKEVAYYTEDGGTVPESVKEKMKRGLVLLNEELKRKHVFPLEFKEGLGPLLDKFDEVRKAKPPTDPKEKQRLNEARDTLAEKIKRTLGVYQQQVTRARDTLEASNPEVMHILLEAIKKIEGVLATLVKHTPEDINYMAEEVDLAPAWKKAKTASEAAHKKLMTDTRVQVMFKSAKLGVKYPFEFKGGLSDLLGNVHKSFKDVSGKLQVASDKAYKVAVAYQQEIELVSKQMDKALGPRHAYYRELEAVVEPVEKAIAEIISQLKRLTQLK